MRPSPRYPLYPRVARGVYVADPRSDKYQLLILAFTSLGQPLPDGEREVPHGDDADLWISRLRAELDAGDPPEQEKP